MIRAAVQFLCILNILAITLCISLAIHVPPSEEAVPTWEYLMILPAINSVILLMFQMVPSVRNDNGLVVLTIFSSLPLGFLLIPMLFIKPDAKGEGRERKTPQNNPSDSENR
jgi:hypothetical protein